MLVFHFMAALSWVTSISLVAALAPMSNSLQVRNAPGMSSADTLGAIRRSLYSAILKRDTDKFTTNSTSLDSSWDGVVLFSIDGSVENQSGNASLSAGMEVVCTTCYIRGDATAQFTLDKNFNFTQTYDNIISNFTDEIGNFTSEVVTYAEDAFGNVTVKVFEDGLDADDFDLPPFPFDFNLAVPDIPESELQFQFDNLELYMQVDTILSGGATYTINLYTSKSLIGFAVTEDLFVGVVFTVDLILAVEAEIDISSGFHIQLNDGISINLPLFNNNVSSITFNGGNFEFLPVTIQTAGVVLSATLRIGVKAGVGLELDTDALDVVGIDIRAGIEVGVWVDIATFKTNVTATPGQVCELRVIEEYVLAIGAHAGASLVIDENTWGPSPETTIPIYSTTLAEACAVSKTASAVASASTTAASKVARDDAEIITTVTKITSTATQCLSTGLINCPASLQTIRKSTTKKTLTATVTSGVDPVFVTANTIVNTVAFGSDSHKMISTSGTPVSYTESPLNTGGGAILKGKTGGVSNKLIIGVSVGVGVPVLIAIIAGIAYCCKRRRSNKNAETAYYSPPGLPTPEAYTPNSPSFGKKSPNVNVVEYRRGS